MPAQVAPQATKPRRKRDQSRLYPETPIGRVINMTPEGKAYFASAPIAFNSALHYAARHTKIKAKRLRKMFKIQRREAATILRKLQGIRESNRSNKENQIRVTEDHITKTKAKLAKMQKTGRSKWMGPTKDKVQRLTDKLNKQLRPKLSDSCGRNVHLRIKEAFVLTLLVEWWTERRNCLVTTLFSALNAATWTRKAVLVHTPSVAMADQWVCY